MTRHKKELMECARMLKLGNLTEHLEELLHQAQEKQLTYPEFLLACLREEVRTRENRKYLCRLKAAGLPARHDLDRYDFTRTEGIDSRKLRELRELVWVGQAYNLLLAGGSGTGKTYIAAGLVHEAVKAGYRAYMVTLEDLLTCLKTRDVSRHAMKTYKRIMKAQLLAIDNATLFPLKREDIMLLFKLVNEFQEKTSLIVTANYSLTDTEWLAIPGEEAVAAALLDRLLYCCEIIQLSRNSYRMENRKTIFSNRSEDTDTLKELTTVK
ncbi:IS21-like element helper ATPase IstB [Bacteroides uniformis]|nr:IS21-like element helper ATPase IstB [Bacteroides uniformis]MDC1807844.1 IS21-like element helper ATPase IstB [Bacteroides uniformis]